MAPELFCLAMAIFFEARGEPIDGKELVANVVINRVAHSKYPDTICGVVKQRKQFSFTHDGMSDNPLIYNTYHDTLAWEESKDMARYVLDTGVVNEYIIMYHNTDVNPYWTDSYSLSGQVGKHIFYQEDY
jgi:spore germination cell wall hydrolase CwlJ-like protein